MDYVIVDRELEDKKIAKRQRNQIIMAIFLSFMIIAFTCLMVFAVSTANEMTTRHVSKFYEEYHVNVPEIMREAWAVLGSR